MKSAQVSERTSFKYVPTATLAVLAATAIFFLKSIFADADTYWHLRTGQWILDHLAVPVTDPFSWTSVGKAWTAHEWLAEVLLASAYQLADWRGVALATGLSVGASILILGSYLRRWLSARAMLIFLAFATLAAAPSFLARPHVFALPVLLLWTINLMAAREHGRAPPLWSSLLMVLWANLHGSFVFGLALVAPFALEAVLARWPKPAQTIYEWGVFGGASAAAALINPQGIKGVLYPISLMMMSSLPSIQEWHSADFSHFSMFETILLEGLFFALWLGVRLPAVRVILLLGLLHMALQHVRHQLIFSFVAPLLFAEPVARALQDRGITGRAAKPDPLETKPAAIAVSVALLAAICVRLAMPLPRNDDWVTPASALAAVPPGLLKEPVFNDYNLGGYLIFRNIRTFIDGRSDMYGDKYFKKYQDMTSESPEALRSDLSALGVRWTILGSGSAAVKTLDRTPGWRRLYADKYAIVHVLEHSPINGRPSPLPVEQPSATATPGKLARVR